MYLLVVLAFGIRTTRSLVLVPNVQRIKRSILLNAVNDAESMNVTQRKLLVEIEPASYELDGARKAFALFNSGLIRRDEVFEYAKDLAEKERRKKEIEVEKVEAIQNLEKAKLKAVEDATKKSFDLGAAVIGFGVGAVETVVSTSQKAVVSTADVAVSKTKNALSLASRSAVDSLSKTAKGALDATVDGLLDFTVRKPVEKVKLKAIETATAPQRAMKNAVDEVSAVPVRTAETIKKNVLESKKKAEEEANEIIESVKRAPTATKETALVATKLAKGALKLAAQNIAPPQNLSAVSLLKNTDLTPTLPKANTSALLPAPAVDSEKIVQVVNSAAENAAEAARRAAQQAAQNALESARASVRETARLAREEQTERELRAAEAQQRIDDIAQRLATAQQSILSDMTKEQNNLSLALSSPQVDEDLRNRTLQVRERRNDRLLLEPEPQEPPKLPRTVQPAIIQPAPLPIDEKKAVSIANARFEAQLASIEQDNEQKKTRNLFSLRDDLVQQSSDQATRDSVLLREEKNDDDDQPQPPPASLPADPSSSSATVDATTASR